MAFSSQTFLEFASHIDFPSPAQQSFLEECCYNAEKPTEELRSLLLDAVTTQTSPGVRYCGVQWANKLYPFSDASARYICVLAAGDKKVEVAEAGVNGLKPESFSGMPSVPTSCQ